MKIESFTMSMLCRKCGRARQGGARLCHCTQVPDGAEHLHWTCPCTHEWVTWPADDPKGEVAALHRTEAR